MCDATVIKYICTPAVDGIDEASGARGTFTYIYPFLDFSCFFFPRLRARLSFPGCLFVCRCYTLLQACVFLPVCHFSSHTRELLRYTLSLSSTQITRARAHCTHA